jgi:hypothetical protein
VFEGDDERVAGLSERSAESRRYHRGGYRRFPPRACLFTSEVGSPIVQCPLRYHRVQASTYPKTVSKNTIAAAKNGRYHVLRSGGPIF